MKRTTLGLALIVALLAVLLAPPSRAAALVGGGFQSPVPVEPDPVGASQVATKTIPFASLGYTGTLTSTVYTNDSSNPYGPNALTFTYLVTNDAASNHVLSRFTVSDFANILTDTSYQATGGIVPTSVDRATDDVVGFNFLLGFGAGPITPGNSSALLVVQTNATTFADSIATVINGTPAVVSSYAPRAIPEPATAGLLAVAAAGFLARRRRRRSC